MKFKGFCSALLLCLAGSPAFAKDNDQITVLASVKPLQLIAEAVVGDLGETDVLIPAGASPHHYALKPSDRRKLQRSDIVLWVGPDLELFLEKALHNSGANTLTLLPAEDEHHEGETAEEHAAHAKHDEHHEEDAHGDHDAHGEEGHHDHHHGGTDPHLWMNPMQALVAAEKLTERLSELYPQHQAALQQNLLAFSRALIKTDQQLKTQLAAQKEKGFFVFHDAYGYFMDRYDLNVLGEFTVDPGRPIGTRHLSNIRKQLKAGDAECVFGEPQFKAAVVKSITDGLDVGYGELDPLAIDIEVSKTGYTEYLTFLGNQINDCLAKR